MLAQVSTGPLSSTRAEAGTALTQDCAHWPPLRLLVPAIFMDLLE